jgi:hypothetical protein
MPRVNNVLERSGTFRELRAFAAERLPLRGCGVHGPACGIHSASERLCKILHQRGALDDVGGSVGWIITLPEWQSLVELMLGRSCDGAYHTRVLSPLEAAGVVTAWSRDLRDISRQPAWQEFLKIVAPFALFPPAPLEADVSRAWLEEVARVDDEDVRDEVSKSIPAVHYAGPDVYTECARNSVMLALLVEKPPQSSAVREEVFARLQHRLTAETPLALESLRAGWVPSRERARWIRRLAWELVYDRHNAWARGDVALELVQLLGNEDPEVTRVAEAAAQFASRGLSAKAAETLLDVARKLPLVEERLVDAAVLGVTRRVADAVELSKLVAANFLQRIGDAAARVVLRSRCGPDAVVALRKLQISSALREQVVALVLSRAEAAPSAEFLLDVLDLQDIAPAERVRLATQCARAIAALGQPRLARLAGALAGHPLACDAARAVCVEMARASTSAASVIEALEHFSPEDPPTREELTLRAIRLVSPTRERSLLERLLTLVDPAAPAYAAAVDEAVCWHPRHPAVAKRRDAECKARQHVRASDRSELLRNLSDATPIMRLRAILSHQRNMNYWPTTWADVDDTVIAVLSDEKRSKLGERLSHGAREWRALSRRMLRVGDAARVGGGGSDQ